MKNLTAITLLILTGLCILNVNSFGKAPGVERPATLPDTNTKSGFPPLLFAPGEIKITAPRNAAPAFSPAGDLIYFGQAQLNGDCAIMRSVKKGKGWSDLQTASFSGQYRDLEPAFSPDGKYLIFASNRPAKTGDSVLTGHYNRQLLPKRGGNLWKVEFSDKGPGEPERLPVIINANSSVFSPAIAGDGSLYFMRADSGGQFHIYRSQNKNGTYQEPIKLPFAINNVGDYDPVVSPDDSFMIFSSSRPPATGVTGLFIVFRTGKGWSKPTDLRDILSKDVFGIEARLSPDLKTLYFSNSQNAAGIKAPTEQNIWRIDISALLRAHAIKIK